MRSHPHVHNATSPLRHFDLAAHRYAASAFIEQSFYIFGGWDPEAPGSGGTFKDEAWQLDLDTMVWTAMAPMPCGPISRHTACTLGDGTVLVHTFRGVFVLDQASGTLSEKSTSGDKPPEGLSMCAASPLGDKSMDAALRRVNQDPRDVCRRIRAEHSLLDMAQTPP